MSTKPISFDQAAELLTELAPEHAADWEYVLDLSRSWQLWDGDLHDEHYSREGAVIVRGNVFVSGNFLLSYDDVVIVVGNVTCERADLRGEALITGDLTARSFVYANSGNDYGLTVVETMRTKLFVEEGTATSAKHFDCEVWRTMNQVVQTGDGHRFEKTDYETTTLESARNILGESEALELADRADLQE